MTESLLQEMVAQYLRTQYPDVVFRSDLAAGMKLTTGQAAKFKRMQAGRAYPDMFIATARHGHHGIYIELKKEGTRIYLKNGQMTSDKHIREQNDMLEKLKSEGYYAVFACGWDAAKTVIDWYLN